MKRVAIAVMAVASVLCMSCEKAVISAEEDPEELGQGDITPATMYITTRGSGNDPAENAVKQGRIYIFNSSNACVAMLSTTEESNEATAQLVAGTYTLYAVGSEDLTRFNLPTQESATPASVITRAEGKVMDDLMLKSATVTLDEGESLRQTMTLDHMVLNIKQIDITKVPDNVTNVELTLSPLYSSIQLVGTYPTEATESYKITLTKAANSNTWSATPNQYLFPSKGTPTIKVSFTTAEGTKSYSYTASESLPANHHFTLSGTYTANEGVSLTGVLLASDWGEDITVTFGFDENDKDPVAGQTYKGYYVISVDETNHTALLLEKLKVEFEVPTETTQEAWLAAFNTALAGVEKPVGASGDWRLPTLAEATIFTSDASLYPNKTKSSVYFCMNGETLNWVQTTGLPSSPQTNNGTSVNSTMYLRPVITITY